MRIPYLLCAGLSVAGILACGGDAPTDESTRDVASVRVMPDSHTFIALGETEQFGATARDASNDAIAGATFDWSSSNTEVASVDASGVVTAVANGTATITATASGVSGTATVMVDQVAFSVQLTSPIDTLTAVGLTTQLTATAVDARDNALPESDLSWQTSDPSVATVSATGLVTAVANGTASISAGADQVADSALITVNQIVTSVVVMPTADTLTALDDNLQLAAEARDANDTPVPDIAFDWMSSDLNVVTVDSTGLVTAVGNGLALVAATTGALSDTAEVSVEQAVAGMTVSPDSLQLFVGDTARLTAQPVDANGNAVADVPVTWSSGDTVVATVDTAGLVTGVGAVLGPVTILAAADAFSDSASVEVVVTFTGNLVAGGGLTSDAGHTCATTAVGPTYCWGGNSDGQLGVDSGPGGTVHLPHRVAGGLIFQTLSAGTWTTCGVAGGQTAYCWGENDDGQLGTGTAPGNETTPATVTGALNWESVDGGNQHTCGVTTGMDAYCWGYNADGQLGDSSLVSAAAPVAVAGGLSFQEVSAGGHSCGITASADAYCWGPNNRGQLGDSSTTRSLVPRKVSGSLTFSTIDAGVSHTCGIAVGGSAYCWGENTWGQLGDGSNDSSLVPVEVSGGLTFRQLSVGQRHTCAVTTDGIGYCWGENADGQLGNGTMTDSSMPVAIPADLIFQSLEAADVHTCGLTEDDVVYCWGRSSSGQLGVGEQTTSAVPLRVIGQGG